MEGQGIPRRREGVHVSFIDFQRGIFQKFAKSDGGIPLGVKSRRGFPELLRGIFLKCHLKGGLKIVF